MKMLLVQSGMQGWLDGTREDIGADNVRAVFYTAAECRAYVKAMRGMVQGGAEVMYRVLIVDHDGERFTSGEELGFVIDGSEVFQGRR